MTAAEETRASPAEGIGEEDVLHLLRALENQDERAVLEQFAPLHPADQAALLHALDSEQRRQAAAITAAVLEPETLNWLDADVRDEVIEALGPKAAAAVLAELESDDAVEIMEDLDQGDRDAILEEMPAAERAQVEQALAYPDYTAARLVKRDNVVVPDFWTVGQTIDYCRDNSAQLPEEFWDILIVDPKMRPVGQVQVAEVLRSQRDTTMRSLRLKEQVVIDAATDQEEVARIFRRHGLNSAPVVDSGGRLMGIVTLDDIVEVVEEEAEDDLLRLGGVAESDRYTGPWLTALHRLPWLAINLATAVVASMVIGAFEGSIQQLTALAVLMPIIASMGGNAGTQTLTVTVRALAVGRLGRRETWKLIGKESVVGLLNGGGFLVIGLATAFLWFWQGELAIIFGIAMLVNVAVAGLAGAAIPLGLQRLGLDPAIASTVFLTTVTDVVGFFTFLGMASVVLL
ncbi:magnesium transporter [Geminicoccus roseus]|uniref:magnesium transporter n=1 Tax=Geminicoccus roseus TaxID=404900 RepID=UPI0004187B6A|nr:magnesium transporter [Geminicoccus roseus]